MQTQACNGKYRYLMKAVIGHGDDFITAQQQQIGCTAEDHIFSFKTCGVPPHEESWRNWFEAHADLFIVD